MDILIVGGSGGIGAAILKVFLASRPEANLYATYLSSEPKMSSERLQWIQVDASSERDIEVLAGRIPRLDIIVNAAGFLHNSNQLPEKSVREFDPGFFAQNIEANTLPTLLLAKHFERHLKSSSSAVFVSLSARIGSIEDNRIGGWISYRASKAALNMALKTISIEWKRKVPSCCVFAFHPGTTDTELSKPFQRNVPDGKLFSPAYVAECLYGLIGKLDADDSGKFFAYDEKEILW